MTGGIRTTTQCTPRMWFRAAGCSCGPQRELWTSHVSRCFPPLCLPPAVHVAAAELSHFLLNNTEISTSSLYLGVYIVTADVSQAVAKDVP